jgi:hypothetical protein
MGSCCRPSFQTALLLDHPILGGNPFFKLAQSSAIQFLGNWEPDRNLADDLVRDANDLALDQLQAV